MVTIFTRLSFFSIVGQQINRFPTVNRGKKILDSGRQEEDHLHIDSRTTEKGWTFFWLGFLLFFNSQSFVLLEGLGISLGELN